MSYEAEESILVCYACIGDPFLSKEARQIGESKTCNHCGSVRESIPLHELAERIDKVLQLYFKLTPENPSNEDEFLERMGIRHWYRKGEPVSSVIAGIADVKDEVAEAVRNRLYRDYERWAYEYDRENPYHHGACYEDRVADPGRFLRIWEEYVQTLCSDKPILTPQAKSALDEIFGDLDSYPTFTNEPIVREIRAGGEDRFVWRARQAKSKEELEKFLKSPVEKIGPPPPCMIKGGRMNAAGVSMFYGAFEKNTCIAEIRALVGSPMVIAQFELIRDVKLLDFNSLASIDDEPMYFDPEYAERRSRAAFFRWLDERIGRPVMPLDEKVEYAPTQMMAEYLASKDYPHFDGVIYRSSQTDGDGLNLALFKHASGVQESDLPSPSNLHAFLPDFHESTDREPEHETIYLLAGEYNQVNAPPSLDEAPSQVEASGCEEGSSSCTSQSGPTLRLNKCSVFVHYARRVEYISDTYEVSWSSLDFEDPLANISDADLRDLPF